jgi:hypothetical protein
MRREIEIYELIERYLNNQLSADELSDIKARIVSDPGFAYEVEKQRNIHNLIHDSSLIQISDELKKIHKRHTSPKRFLRNWRWSFVFAPIVLLISSWLIIQKKQQTKNINPEIITGTEEIHENFSQDTIISREKILNTTHPQRQVQQSNIKTKQKIEPAEQQENITFPAAYTNHGDSSEKVTVANTIEVIQPKIEQFEKTQIYKTKDNSKSTETLNTQPCDQVNITADLEIKESCIEKPTGRIFIDKGSIRGGSPPYEVSINNAGSFVNQMTFTSLIPGNYKVYIRDKNNCVQLLGNYNIESKFCSYEFVFAPDKGEVWSIPEYEVPFTLKIFSKKGICIFTERIDYSGGYEWNGRTDNGDELPMGAYMFVLESANKEPFYGTITLVR